MLALRNRTFEIALETSARTHLPLRHPTPIPIPSHTLTLHNPRDDRRLNATTRPPSQTSHPAHAPSPVADMRRHIEHQHTEEEAQATIDGKITKTQATLLGEDWKGTIKKPTCEGWVLTGAWFMLSGQTFSRKDAVKRHQTETGARVVDGVCVSCPGSGNGAGAGKKRARRK
ncbi:hypothetical protein RHS01_10299 [Rhizoctonia solani]|uniref:Uncharacterized protein n=1 Tax=Rhizoctonia solani TaxID=456999 RepID=A0A8H7I5D7_9AGAM|nr:hypothetical protein RHS01_10299 [Rhizoctonia solani]